MERNRSFFGDVCMDVKNDDINIGYNIKRIRTSKKMKQKELLERMQLKGLNISREILSQIERGKHHVTASQLKTIKEILDTTYDELLKEVDE